MNAKKQIVFIALRYIVKCLQAIDLSLRHHQPPPPSPNSNTPSPAFDSPKIVSSGHCLGGGGGGGSRPVPMSVGHTSRSGPGTKNHSGPPWAQVGATIPRTAPVLQVWPGRYGQGQQLQVCVCVCLCVCVESSMRRERWPDPSGHRSSNP